MRRADACQPRLLGTPHERAGLVHELRAAERKADERVRLQMRDMRGELAGGPLVIGIAKADIACAGGGNAAVARSGEASVRLAHDPHARVLPADSLRDHRRVVGRAIVHHDDLEPLAGLQPEACERLLQRRRGVEGGHDDRGNRGERGVANMGHGTAPRSRSQRENRARRIGAGRAGAIKAPASVPQPRCMGVRKRAGASARPRSARPSAVVPPRPTRSARRAR